MKRLPPYTGSGAYCYSDSLHTCLLAAGAEELPDPGFLECLTTLPFGNTYLKQEDGPLIFFDGLDPDRGPQRAMSALGWTCDESHGGSGEEALERLRTAVEGGPVLVGPVDMGHLPYNPEAPHGADHFVVALAVDRDRVLMHDPAGYPCAALTTEELLVAWRADDVDYKRGPYTLRRNFRRTESFDREAAVSRTLPLALENLTKNPGGPTVYGGVQAVRMLAEDLRGNVPATLAAHLTRFALPLAARRALDAARFLDEAGKEDVARLVEEQARLFGEAQYLAVAERWSEAADLVERIAVLEGELAAVWEAA